MTRADTIVDKIIRNPELALGVYEQLQARLGELKIVTAWTMGRLPDGAKRELRRDDTAGKIAAVVWLDDTGFFRWSLKDPAHQAVANTTLLGALGAADAALTEDGYLLTGETPPIALPWSGGGRADAEGNIVAFIKANENGRYKVDFGGDLKMNLSHKTVDDARTAADNALESLGWVLL